MEVMLFMVSQDTFSRIRSLASRGTRDLRLLVFTVFCYSFGFMGVYMATATNFAVQIIHIKPMQQGYLEAVRETPGFLVVLVAAVTMQFAEPILACMALSLLALGLAAYYGVHGFHALMFYSFIWSIGIHLWMTIQPSMTMSLAEKNSKGRRLGQLSAVGSLGTVLGMVLVREAGGYIGMRRLFLIAAVFIVSGAISAAFISKDIGHKEKPRLVWKRRYSLYYTLTFLEGCRKQVFMTFAIFALVFVYHVKLEYVATLMIINNVVNFILAPKVGRLIDRIGERKVLAFCYAALIPVFIGYATIKNPHVLFVFYCLDSLFFLGSIGLNTYLHKIADPVDVMPSLAMGVSMNHVAAVAVPLIGGYLWTKYSYPTTFLGGAVVVAISVIMALRIKTGVNPALGMRKETATVEV